MNKGQKLNLIRNFNMNRSQRERLIKLLGENNSGGGENDKDFLNIMREFEGKVATSTYGPYNDKFVILDDTYCNGTNVDLFNFLNTHYDSYNITENDINNPLFNIKPLTYANGNAVTVDEWKEVGSKYLYSGSFETNLIAYIDSGYTYKFYKSYESEEDTVGFITNMSAVSSDGYEISYAFFSYNDIVYHAKYFAGHRMNGLGNNVYANLSVHRVTSPNWIVNHTGSYFPNKATFNTFTTNLFNLYYNEYIFYFNLMIEATENTTITKKVYDEKTGAAFNVTFDAVAVKDSHNFITYNLSLTSVTAA